MKTLDTNKVKRLIVKRLIGEITPDEQQALDEWLARSEANRELHEELSSANFIKEAVTDDHSGEQAAVWDRIDRLTLRARRITLYRHLARVAAVIAILLGVTLAYWSRKDTPSPVLPLARQTFLPGTSKPVLELPDGKEIVLNSDTSFQSMGTMLVNREDTLDISQVARTAENAAEYHTIRVPRGGEYVAKLEDGTVVHLNADSELRVPVAFTSDAREVFFKGEAYFSVAKDVKRPFTIHSGEVDIRVLGTEFCVRSYATERDILTTLVEGSVEVSRDAVTRRLSPDEQARVSCDGDIRVSRVNVYPYIAWQTGRIAFENERLEYVMDELARWYDVDVAYENQQLKDLRFIIDIKKYSDLTELLSLMEKMNKVSFRVEDRTVVIGEQKEDDTANTILRGQ